MSIDPLSMLDSILPAHDFAAAADFNDFVWVGKPLSRTSERHFYRAAISLCRICVGMLIIAANPVIAGGIICRKETGELALKK